VTGSDHIYKHIRLTGTSGESLEAAINAAVARAASTVRGLRWFEVVETRGHIRGDRVDQWQVTVDIAFNIED
jgi:flavin-binding protein dodecin